MQKFYGKVTDANGSPVASARLSVYTENVNSPLPPIYRVDSNGALVSQANPLLTDSDGQYEFVTGDGSFTVRATGSSAVLNISKTVTQYTVPVATAAPVASKLNQQIFTSGSLWQAPFGVTQATITCLAGGSGGQAGGSGFTQGGTGGNGGATVRRTIGVISGDTYAITIGAGGNGGSPSFGAGVTGGNTSFGTVVTASGQTGTTTGYGGPVGRNVTADSTMIIFNGFGGICSGGSGGAGGATVAGSPGVTVETYAGGALGAALLGNGGGGGGGSSPYGAGGKGGNNTTSLNVGNNGVDATGYGSGGGGGPSGIITGGSGGKGTQGLCIVEWIS